MYCRKIVHSCLKPSTKAEAELFVFPLAASGAKWLATAALNVWIVAARVVLWGVAVAFGAVYTFADVME